jgi:hypothetical protein
MLLFFSKSRTGEGASSVLESLLHSIRTLLDVRQERCAAPSNPTSQDATRPRYDRSPTNNTMQTEHERLQRSEPGAVSSFAHLYRSYPPGGCSFLNFRLLGRNFPGHPTVRSRFTPMPAASQLFHQQLDQCNPSSVAFTSLRF